MTLSFLGATYNYQPRNLETTASEQTGRFLGKTYTIRRPVATTPPQQGRKYRGVAY